MKARVSPAHRSSLKQGCRDGDDRYEENADSIIVIIIERPKYQTAHLKDVERMESLGYLSVGLGRPLCTTYFVDKKLGNSLLLDADLVFAKDLLASVALVAIKSSTYRFHVGPT